MTINSVIQKMLYCVLSFSIVLFVEVTYAAVAPNVPSNQPDNGDGATISQLAATGSPVPQSWVE